VSDHTIKFQFNSTKAAQAAYRLLSMAGGKLNYMVLVKLLYLADRKALMELESPITGDRLTSLPHGPALSHILDLIRFGPIYESDAPWFRAVSPPIGYDVQRLEDIGDGELSNAEDQILKRTFEEYGTKTWQELSRLTHDLPEWTNPIGSSIPIPFENVLLLAGKTSEDLQRIREELAALRKVDSDLTEYVCKVADHADLALAG
jgi:uncharacterized phage-associated protein